MLLVGVSNGVSGWYAVVYDSETGEPQYTGVGRYMSVQEANYEAIDIATAEELDLEPALYRFYRDLVPEPTQLRARQ